MTRRSLITRLALSASPLLAESAPRPPHTLIHVFLRGGADTLNFFIPYADDRYHRLRPSLAIPQSASLRLSDHYALHPALRPLEAAFKEGRFGAVQAVGIDNTSGSHFECQDQMEHGDSMHAPPIGGGWLGRFLRSSQAQTSSSLAAIAIGTTLPESLRGAPAVSVFERLQDISISSHQQTEPRPAVSALEKLYGADVTLLGKRGLETLDLFKRVAALQSDAAPPAHGAQYPDDAFAQGLREIARLIKANLGLQIACIDLPGWDTHFFQGQTTGLQAEKMSSLAGGLAALDLDLKSHRSQFTVVITTEFGRRVYENASLGTDHGRGFAFMALGDRVKGGQVLGRWPIRLEEDLAENPPGPGGLHAEIDYRNLFAETLQSCFPSPELATIFPGFSPTPSGLFH